MRSERRFAGIGVADSRSTEGQKERRVKNESTDYAKAHCEPPDPRESTSSEAGGRVLFLSETVADAHRILGYPVGSERKEIVDVQNVDRGSKKEMFLDV